MRRTVTDLFTVPKRSSSDEPQPSIDDHSAKNPALEIIHQALPCLFPYNQRHEQTILSSLRQGYPHPSLLYDHSQRPVYDAFEEKHAVEQSG